MIKPKQWFASLWEKNQRICFKPQKLKCLNPVKHYKQPEEQLLKSVLYFSLGFSSQNPWHRKDSYRRSQSLPCTIFYRFSNVLVLCSSSSEQRAWAQWNQHLYWGKKINEDNSYWGFFFLLSPGGVSRRLDKYGKGESKQEKVRRRKHFF